MIAKTFPARRGTPAWAALALCALAVAPACFAQAPQRTIEARSAPVRIVDDGDVLQGQLVEGLNPDVHVYHPSPRTKHIAMITDADRADFTLRPGETVDFAVRRGGRLYNQRFAPIDPNFAYRGAASAKPGAADTIPFRLGPNNAIHVIGSVNGSRPLDLFFDTGASAGVLTETGEAKGGAILEGSRNRLRIGGAGIAGLTFVRIGYRGSAHADGVIGFNAFAGRVVRIDYDRMVLVISPQMPALPPGYHKAEFVWRGQNSLVPLAIGTGKAKRDILALFDTGSRWSLTLSSRDPAARALGALASRGSRSGTKADGSHIYGKVVDLPSMALAGFALPNVQADIEQGPGDSNLSFNIVGNDFLKRFNAVIDYRTGEIYLKPNHLRDAPYNSVFDRRLPILGGVLALSIAGLAAAYYRRRRKRRRQAR
jgi:hypothetical protein